jgi:hypothetical protein
MHSFFRSRRHHTVMIRSHLGRRCYSTLKQFREEALERLQVEKHPEALTNWTVYAGPDREVYVGSFEEMKGNGYGRWYKQVQEEDGSVTKEFEAGEFRNGLLYGLGHSYMQSTAKGHLEWHGGHKYGAFTGFGWNKWVLPDGTVVKREGEFIGDKLNGFGIYEGSNNIYYGNLVLGKKEGYGEWDTENCIIKGYFKNDSATGFSAMKSIKPNEMYLEVDSIEFKANGIGICQYGEDLGSKQYRGEFQNDHWHGYGVMTIATDPNYEWSGKWTNNKMETPGLQRLAPATHCGDFKNGTFTGFGTIVYDGSSQIYYGEFEDYIPIGYGIYEIEQGHAIAFNGKPVAEPTQEQIEMAELAKKRAHVQSRKGEANAVKARELASKLTFSQTLHPRDCIALKKEMEQHTKDLKHHYDRKREVQSLLYNMDTNMECVSDFWKDYTPPEEKKPENVRVIHSANHLVLDITDTKLTRVHNFMTGDFLKRSFALMASKKSRKIPDLYNVQIMQYFYRYKDLFKEYDSNLEDLILDSLGSTIQQLKKDSLEVMYMKQHLGEVFRQLHTRPNFNDMISKLLQTQTEGILCVEDALIDCHIPQTQQLLEQQLSRNGVIGTDNIKSLKELDVHIKSNPYVAPYDKVILSATYPNLLWAHYYASGNENNLTAMINSFDDYYSVKQYMVDNKIDKGKVVIEGFGHSSHWSMGTHMIYHSKIFEYCDQLVSHLTFKEAKVKQLEVNSLLTSATIARKIIPSEELEEKVLNSVSKLIQN